MEEPTKYEVEREKVAKEELYKLEELFADIGRQNAHFMIGDIVVTVENRIHQVGHDLSEDKAIELLEAGCLKALYPAETSIDLK